MIIIIFIPKEIFNIFNHLDARRGEIHNLKLKDGTQVQLCFYFVGLPEVSQNHKVIYHFNFHSNLAL